MWGARREIETIARLQVDVSVWDMEDDGTGDAEEHLVELVSVLGVGVAGLVRPGAGVEPFVGEGGFRLGTSVTTHK
jgi:hypothetical protein